MLKPKTDFKKVFQDRAKAFVQAFNKAVIYRLSYLGEQCVNHARSLDTYKDQTGNLRSSIGYIIVKDGQIVKKSFVGSTVEGKQTGLTFASQLASEIGLGWGLIVVAGMNYALKVESMGLDVLTSGEQLAKSELDAIVKDIAQDVVAALNK
ncbi:hypothetical protein [Spirosoma aerophilum]